MKISFEELGDHPQFLHILGFQGYAQLEKLGKELV
jgi:hypothetical protein